MRINDIFTATYSPGSDPLVTPYFPDEGKVYLLNLDYDHERKCVLQQFGDKDFITLKPAEFRILESVRLEADEKLNGR